MTAGGESLARVRAAQTQVRQFGLDLIASIGNASPTLGTVRIGPVPCAGGGGSYRIEGSWQVPLAPEKHHVTLRAVRDSWPGLGWQVLLYEESGNKITLEGQDPRSGITFSISSTTPPHAVKIAVATPCTQPPDGTLPAHSLTVFE
ncbi:hypothetical protein Rhe02_69350 [Rhizocola hellebori]|uniref:Uncharacterized protein n=1 Tax=Rhizocola hellebori TaxID=1392758 RepID=A0A8J3QDG8_9ACTN|nr:hypothetical protein [Rhizocola hellebori]GIH08868.1 hypothetical protein Rhe02_69350 [Rhizocola hellebori]